MNNLAFKKALNSIRRDFKGLPLEPMYILLPNRHVPLKCVLTKDNKLLISIFSLLHKIGIIRPGYNTRVKWYKANKLMTNQLFYTDIKRLTLVRKVFITTKNEALYDALIQEISDTGALN